MKNFIIKRFFQLIPTLLGLSMLTFLLMHIAPGDPAQRLLTTHTAVTQEVIDEKREELGLNAPLYVQFGNWLFNAVQGDLGVSYHDEKPIVPKLNSAFKNTIILTSASILLSLLVAIVLGIYSAVRQNGIADYIIRFVCFVGNSIPNFLLCIFLMYTFCLKLKLFSVIGENSIKGLFLPVISLSIPLTSSLIRQIRVELLDQLQKEYITVARMRGVKEIYVLLFNGVRNSLPSLITVIGLSIGGLLGGSVIVENIFSWSGLGKLVIDAINNRDYPIIQGFILYIALMYTSINLIIDLSHRHLDPRIGR